MHKSFKKIIKNKTTLYISHRISNITNADKIIVIDGGQVVEEDSHDNLIKQKKLYYDLYNLQSLEGNFS